MMPRSQLASSTYTLGGAEGDTYDNALRTRAANSENDTKAS